MSVCVCWVVLGVGVAVVVGGVVVYVGVVDAGGGVGGVVWCGGGLVCFFV